MLDTGDTPLFNLSPAEQRPKLVIDSAETARH
jgi:hypothetical protein